MTLNDLEVFLSDDAHARRALRSEDAAALLKGTFGIGRLPYIHTAMVGTTEVRVKFVDTVKQILNSKGKEVPGKESFLSYLEVTVCPAGKKAFSYTVDVKQVVWGTSRSKALATHAENTAALAAFAETLGIDLTAPTAWCTTYSMNY